MKSAAKTLTIVIAWVEVVMDWDGCSYAADMGHRAKMVERRVAKSCVWLTQGDESDVRKAKAYALESGYKVFTYPEYREDARAAAEKEVLVE